MRKTLKKRGFTLAELLVVVAIIAVLVAVSIPIFTGQLSKAKDTVCENNRETLRHLYAVETLQNGAPPDLTGARATLAKAIKQADDGEYVTGTSTYKGACGGTCTVTFSGDYLSIAKIECSEHGKSGGSDTKTYTKEELMAGLSDAIKNAGYDGSINLTTIYSGVPKSEYDKFLNQMDEEMKLNLQGKSYAIESTSGKTFDTFRIVYYDGVLDSSVYNKQVDVTIMSSDGKKYDGKRYVQTKTEGGKRYYIIATM